MKKEMGFQEIKEAIENAPITYLPALLLVQFVELCSKQGKR